jgi:hypothetical protein
MSQPTQDPRHGWEQWQHRNDPPPPPPPPPRYPLEYRVPVVLAVLGLAALFAAAWFRWGKEEARETVVSASAFFLLIMLPATLLGLQLVGRIFKISYGPPLSAVVKLIGFLLFIGGLLLAGILVDYTFTAIIVLVPVSWFLMVALFDLDGWDLVTSIFGLWVFFLVLWAVFWLTVWTLDLRKQKYEKEKEEQETALVVSLPGPQPSRSVSPGPPAAT